MPDELLIIYFLGELLVVNCRTNDICFEEYFEESDIFCGKN